MGQDILVIAKMKSPNRFLSLHIACRAHYAIENSGKIYRESLERVFRELSKLFKDEEFLVETQSNRDFENQEFFKATLKDKKFENVKELTRYFDENTGEVINIGSEINFELPELNSDNYVRMVLDDNYNDLYYQGLNPEEVKHLMMLLQEEFNLDYVIEGTTVFTGNKWMEISELPEETKKKFKL